MSDARIISILTRKNKGCGPDTTRSEMEGALMGTQNHRLLLATSSLQVLQVFLQQSVTLKNSTDPAMSRVDCPAGNGACWEYAFATKLSVAD